MNLSVLAYGIDLASEPAQRFERLTEQLKIITGLWSTPRSEQFSFDGDHFSLAGIARLGVKGSGPGGSKWGIPIILGGLAGRRLQNLPPNLLRRIQRR